MELVLQFESPEEYSQRIDLSFLAERPQLAELFAKVFKVELQPRPAKSRCATAESLKLFRDFLDWRATGAGNLTRTTELTYEILQEFATWLIVVRRLKSNSAANRFSIVTSFLQMTRAHYPEHFSEGFGVPANVFPGSTAGRESKALSRDTLENLLGAAEDEATEILRSYRDGDVPRSVEQLLPFAILLAARTAINPGSLYELKRECLKPHFIDTDSYYVEWTKRRSRSKVQRQLHQVADNPLGTINLIRFLQSYTAPLAVIANPLDRSRLFLYMGRKLFNATDSVITVKTSNVGYYLRRFAARYSLPRIQLNDIRPSVATQHYLNNGRNLRKVQVLLGHKYLSTTKDYISEKVVQIEHNKAMRQAQLDMVNRVIVIPVRAQDAIEDLSQRLPPGSVQSIVDGSYETGWCKCTNPFKSPQPEQMEGQLCTAFLACPTCPNALFFLEDLPRVIAIRNRLVELRQRMSKGVWNALYKDKVNIIEEDIIAVFTEEQIREAEDKAKGMVDIQILMGQEGLN